MTSKYTKYPAEWDLLIAELADAVDGATLEVASELVRLKSVRELSADASNVVSACIVDLFEKLYVELYLDDLPDSACDCCSMDYCEHMLAVLLEYASEHNLPLHGLYRPDEPSSATSASSWPPQAATKAAASPHNRELLLQRAAQIETMSAFEWHELFELCAKPFEKQRRDGQYASKVRKAIEGCMPELAPAKLTLFKLHTLLFLLIKLIRNPQQTGYYQPSGSSFFFGFNTYSAAHDIIDYIKDLFDGELLWGDEPEIQSYVMDTILFLHKEILIENGEEDHLLFEPYRLCWNRWVAPQANDSMLFEEELARLETAAKNAGPDFNDYHRLLAQSWMLFLLSRDEDALLSIRTLADKHGIDDTQHLQFLYLLYTTQQWKRLVVWLDGTVQLLIGQDSDMILRFFNYWNMAIQQLPEAEEPMWRALESLHPAAEAIYAGQLYAHKKWRKWVDYQLSCASEPLSLRADTYKPIEKDDPGLLLPYYHQAVERYVSAKNRDGYKLAVKLLKRLAKLYKKLKREADWERFILSFVNRHSRLRALQEELRKGKLIV